MVPSDLTFSRYIGSTCSGLRVRLDYWSRGAVGAYTIWLRDGDELYRYAVHPFADFGEELCAAHDAATAVEALLAGPDEASFGDVVEALLGPDERTPVDPIRDEPGALGA